MRAAEREPLTLEGVVAACWEMGDDGFHGLRVRSRRSCVVTERAGSTTTDPRVLGDDAEALVAAETVERACRDRASADRRERLDLAGRQGLGSLNVPKPIGGSALSQATIARVVSIVAAADVVLARIIRDHVGLVETIRARLDENGGKTLLHEVSRGLWLGRIDRPTEGTVRLTKEGETLHLSGRIANVGEAFYADLMAVEATDDDGRAVLAFVDRDAEGLTFAVGSVEGGGHGTGGHGIMFDRVDVRRGHILPSDRDPERRTLVSAIVQTLDAAIDAGVASAAIDATIAALHGPAKRGGVGGADKAVDDPFAFRDIAASKVRLHAAEATIRCAGRAIDAVAKASSDDMFVQAGIAVDEAGVLAAEVAASASGTLARLTGIAAPGSTELERRQRDPRLPAHDPLSWRLRAIGDYVLNGVAPPRPFGM